VPLGSRVVRFLVAFTNVAAGCVRLLLCDFSITWNMNVLLIYVLQVCTSGMGYMSAFLTLC
jgi:hypothetical protein